MHGLKEADLQLTCTTGATKPQHQQVQGQQHQGRSQQLMLHLQHTTWRFSNTLSCITKYHMCIRQGWLDGAG